MANRTYTVTITRSGSSGNNTSVHFKNLTVENEGQVQLPAFYITEQSGQNFKIDAYFTDNTSSSPINEEDVTSMVIKVYNGSNVLLATSTSVAQYYPFFIVETWDEDIVSILGAMTEQEVEACKVTVEFNYDSVANSFESTVNYTDLTQ